MRIWASIVCVCGILLAGCGGLESPSTSGRRSGAPTVGGSRLGATAAGRVGTVRATEAKYQGWEALKLTNGIVTVVAVPSIGGRVMEYKLGPHPYLWVNPEEHGKLYDAPKTKEERTWHNYGGYKVWPAPQKQWGGPPDPLGSTLDGGKWTGQIVPGERGMGTVRLVSPRDAGVTGLQITREATLYGGTTRLAIKERFTNVSDKPVSWGIWDVTQVPGSLSKKQKASPQARVYFPLNSDSAHPRGFYDMLAESGGEPRGTEQWLPGVAPGIMGVKYLGQTGKIGADSMAGWIAYVDEAHEYCYVKRFKAEKLGKYPDKGSTVEVYCSGDQSYMEVEVLSPVKDIQPGDSLTFTIDWYGARCGGPIIDCTEVGVTKEPLALEEDRERLVLTGVFGVFLPGTLQIVFEGGDGQELSRIGRVAVSPEKPLELKQTVTVPQDATKVALALLNELGTPIGTLAELDLEVGPIARGGAGPRAEG
ncbi:MAG: hypothetical protein PVH68_19585 [Armatimonadota bacterium]|jgi:hypothetical protein